MRARRSRSWGRRWATTRPTPAYRERVAALNREWDAEVTRVYNHSVGEILTQGEVIGAVEASTDARDVVVTSAGSLPGDLLKLWRSRDPQSYQVEYGYSTMGYEIAGGVGAKLAAPDREVIVMVGDGSFQMMSNEITTAVQEGLKLTIVIVDNKGYSSVGRVSEQVGAEGFGCHYRYRGPSGAYDGPVMQLDFVKMCEGMGAKALEVTTLPELRAALADARAGTETVCIVVQTDWDERVKGYANSWWEMATPMVSEMPAVNAAREEFDRNKGRQRYLMIPGAPFQGGGRRSDPHRRPARPSGRAAGRGRGHPPALAGGCRLDLDLVRRVRARRRRPRGPGRGRPGGARPRARGDRGGHRRRCALGAVGERASVFDEPPAGVVLCAPGDDVEVVAQTASSSPSRRRRAATSAGPRW